MRSHRGQNEGESCSNCKWSTGGEFQFWECYLKFPPKIGDLLGWANRESSTLPTQTWPGEWCSFWSQKPGAPTPEQERNA